MNGFKLSARVPFVSTAAGNSYLNTLGDWSSMPGFSSDGILIWNSGRGVASMQLLFVGVPPDTYLCEITCHIGNGQVLLFGGNSNPVPQGPAVTGKVNTNSFTVDNSGIALVLIISIGNLDHFSFFSATLKKPEEP
jgi:hypothetical protein